jgi:hypothetical protein
LISHIESVQQVILSTMADIPFSRRKWQVSAYGLLDNYLDKLKSRV